MPKGSNYEREICTALSMWWSDGKCDDIFWRTSGSGARATTRNKKGKKTFGQCGDVQASNPSGQPLIDLCSIEIKRGYPDSAFANVIDKPPKAAEQMFETFVYQAEEDATNADAPTWLLIAKRDRRKSLVFMPYSFSRALKKVGCKNITRPPSVLFTMISRTGERYTIFGMTLDNFLKAVKPEYIKLLHKRSIINKGGIVTVKYYTPVVKKKKKKKTKQPEYDIRNDQHFRCLFCETKNSVEWDGENWVCKECREINDYPK